MSDVVALAPAVNDEAVAMLREALELAEKGEVQAVSIVAMRPDGAGQYWTSTMQLRQHMYMVGLINVHAVDLANAVAPEPIEQ